METMARNATRLDIEATLRVPVSNLVQAWTPRLVECGVPVGDVARIASEVVYYEDWCDAWNLLGDSHMTSAEQFESEGDLVGAAELRLVAAMEFHFAKHVFVHDEAARALSQSKLEGAYRAALAHLPGGGRTLTIPLQFGNFSAVLRTPKSSPSPPPVVALVPGLDATKEELHTLSDDFVRRGLATLAVDGPGQGAAEVATSIRGDWEAFSDMLFEFLRAIPDVDATRPAIVGVSMGGYYAARAVAANAGWAAGASIGGFYDLASTWGALPILSRNAFAVRSGAIDMEDAQRIAESLSMKERGVVADGGQFLVLHGSADTLFDTNQAVALASHFGDHGHLRIIEGGDHVCHNRARFARPFVANWVRRHVYGV